MNGMPKLSEWYLPVISTLCSKGESLDLFKLGHEMVDNYPEDPISWYCVGSYYCLIGKYEEAKKYYRYQLSFNSLANLPCWIKSLVWLG